MKVPPDAMKRSAGDSLGAALLYLCCVLMAACGGLGGTIGGGQVPFETRFRIVGTPGTPFHGVISDTVASWEFSGVIPLSVAILNNNPPVQMIAYKLTGDSSLMSLEVISGTAVEQITSTSEPFGTAVLQTGVLPALAPPANPDARFFLKGQVGQFFEGLIEDQTLGVELDDIAPTLFLFEQPDGKVDGNFQQLGSDFGPLIVDLIVDGKVVAHAGGDPTVSVREP
ncbi:MAG: hypothetical protein WA005_14050 [Candidatus Binataceae bacterium]